MGKKLDSIVSPMDELFSTEKQRQDEKLERVQEINISELQGFQNHPFQIRQDEEMQKLCDSIREYGVLSPLLARVVESGGYEIVSGHRRKAAAELLGLDRLPVLVREMSDDEAVVLMVDSNIQRENLLPSEKAFAYKMKLEAMKHQGKYIELTCAQVGHKKKSRDIIAQESGESRETIRRYIRLTELAPTLLELVDEKRIAFSPGVELSYLTKQEQAELWDLIQSEDCTPSLSQAIRMKKLSQQVKLTAEVIFAIMTEEKPNQKEYVKIRVDRLRKYFPRGYTSEQMETQIMKLLDERQKKRSLER